MSSKARGSFFNGAKVSPLERPSISSDSSALEPSESLYVRKFMRLPLIYLRCIGTFHLKSDNIVIKLYNGFMIACMLFNFFKYFPVFRSATSFDKYLVINICFLLWLGVNALHSVLFFYLTEKRSKLNLLIQKTDRLLERVESFESSKSYKRSYFIILFLHAASVSIIISNLAIGALSYYGPSTFAGLFATTFTPFSADDPVGQSPYYKAFVFFLLATSTFGWASYFIFFLSNLVIFKFLLGEFNEQFDKFVHKCVVDSTEEKRDRDPVFNFVSGDPANTDANSDLEATSIEQRQSVTEDDFEHFRLWNLELGSLLRTANDCFKEFLTLSLLSYGPLIFLILFVVSNWTGNCITGILAFAYPFWLVAAAVILGACLHFSAQINTMVRFNRIRSHLFQIQFTSIQ